MPRPSPLLTIASVATSVHLPRSLSLQPAHQNAFIVALMLTVLASTGCQTAQKTFITERPVRHSVSGTGFVIQSDFAIADNASLVHELESLRTEITRTLQLPEQRDPVTLYLFSDEESYRRYMHATWPNLPARRAYFVGSSRELAVYSFHGPRVEEDLRHEFTHGLLHASLNSVPLWLDEGFAEYFEVRGAHAGSPHTSHLRYLQDARADGWNPSLEQLEQVTDFQKMTQRDYAEAWGWVHYMLNGSPSARTALIGYVAQLQTETEPPLLLPLLKAAMPGYYSGMIGHVSNMASDIRLVSHSRM